MAFTSELKNCLRANQLAVGSWLSLGHAGICEIMCNAGFRWVAVDLEHTTTSLEQAEAIIRVADGKGVTPLVRLASHDPVQIKRVMDAGAHGVIAPNIRTAKELAQVAAAMQYPPTGTRGVGLGRAQGYGPGFESYRSWLSESSVLIAQIEHVDALENLDEIMSVQALDAYMIGPYDLSASMGCAGQFNNEQYLAAVSTIVEAGNRHGVCSGTHVVEPDPVQLRQRIDDGFRFIAYSVDFRMIDAACRQGLRGLID